MIESFDYEITKLKRKTKIYFQKKNETDPEKIAELVNARKKDIRMTVVANPHLTREQFEKLAKDRVIDVREGLLFNYNLPPDLFPEDFLFGYPSRMTIVIEYTGPQTDDLIIKYLEQKTKNKLGIVLEAQNALDSLEHRPVVTKKLFDYMISLIENGFARPNSRFNNLITTGKVDNEIGKIIYIEPFITDDDANTMLYATQLVKKSDIDEEKLKEIFRTKKNLKGLRLFVLSNQFVSKELTKLAIDTIETSSDVNINFGPNKDKLIKNKFICDKDILNSYAKKVVETKAASSILFTNEMIEYCKDTPIELDTLKKIIDAMFVQRSAITRQVADLFTRKEVPMSLVLEYLQPTLPASTWEVEIFFTQPNLTAKDIEWFLKEIIKNLKDSKFNNTIYPIFSNVSPTALKRFTEFAKQFPELHKEFLMLMLGKVNPSEFVGMVDLETYVEMLKDDDNFDKVFSKGIGNITSLPTKHQLTEEQINFFLDKLGERDESLIAVFIYGVIIFNKFNKPLFEKLVKRVRKIKKFNISPWEVIYHFVNQSLIGAYYRFNPNDLSMEKRHWLFEGLCEDTKHFTVFKSDPDNLLSRILNVTGYSVKETFKDIADYYEAKPGTKIFKCLSAAMLKKLEIAHEKGMLNHTIFARKEYFEGYDEVDEIEEIKIKLYEWTDNPDLMPDSLRDILLV